MADVNNLFSRPEPKPVPVVKEEKTPLVPATADAAGSTEIGVVTPAKQGPNIIPLTWLMFTAIVAMFAAGFAVIAILSRDQGILSMIMVGLGMPLGAAVMYYSDVFRRASLMNRLMKTNNGAIIIAQSGQGFSGFMVDMNQQRWSVRGNTYFNDKTRVKIFRGIPVLFFNNEDGTHAIDFFRTPGTYTETPKRLESMWLSVVAEAQTNALKTLKGNLEIFIFLGIGLTLAVGAVAFLAYDQASKAAALSYLAVNGTEITNHLLSNFTR